MQKKTKIAQISLLAITLLLTTVGGHPKCTT
jgi:hypothetical protein